MVGGRAGRRPGGGAGADARHAARSARGRPDVAPDRPARPVAGVGLRDPAGRWRRARRRAECVGAPTSASCCAQYLSADDPLAPYADRLTSAALGNQSLRGYLTGSIDAVLRPARSALRGGRLQDELARRQRRRLRRPRGWPRRCCTPTIRCRRCCTPLCCIAFCGGGCRATTRPPSRRGAVSVRARHVRRGDPGDRRAAGGVFGWQPPAGLVRRAVGSSRRGKAGGVTR